jgi:ferrous iron transport protein A
MPVLSQLEKGQAASVVAVLGVDAVSQRLMEMGIVEGEPVQVVAFAPMGDPIEIRVRDYRLSVRKAEAERVLVEPS